MDGIETLDMIRKNYPDAALATPIIALTACAVAGERDRLLEAGFTDYASKPIRISELNEILLKYLPNEKVLYISDAEKLPDYSEDIELPRDLYDISWLNPKEGVEYCGSNRLYLAALAKYADSIGEKAKSMKACAVNDDWESFTITVHSLKSTSMSIGAEEFSDYVREFESAAKKGEHQWIRDNIIPFLELYRSFFWDLKSAIRKNDHFRIINFNI